MEPDEPATKGLKELSLRNQVIKIKKTKKLPKEPKDNMITGDL